MINSERSAGNGIAFQPEDTRDRSKSEVAMTTITAPETGRKEGQHAMNTPPIVSAQEWEAAREQLLVKEICGPPDPQIPCQLRGQSSRRGRRAVRWPKHLHPKPV
jgi:hypothetical protein